MPCTNPITVYWNLGEPKPKFHLPENSREREEFLKTHTVGALPCWKCIDCLNRNATDWMVRQYCETVTSRGIGNHMFLTLTYDDQNIPQYGHTQYSDVQLFVKRLREKQRYYARKKRISVSDIKFKYVFVPEYGDISYRPHYHATVFNLWLPDRKIVPFGKQRRTNHKMPGTHKNMPSQGRKKIISGILEETWGLGNVDIQSASPASMRYLANHNMKQTGEHTATKVKQRWYAILQKNIEQTKKETGLEIPFDSDTGEVLPESIPTPRIMASARPAVGHEYYQRYKNEIYTTDSVVIDGTQYMPPRYFDRLLKAEDPKRFFEIQKKRDERRPERTKQDLERRHRYQIAVRESRKNHNPKM